MRTSNVNRPGHTLLEILIWLTLVSTLISFASVLLHQTYRAERRTRQSIAIAREARRLARLWSDDVHAAVRVTTIARSKSEPPKCEMHRADGTLVRYAWIAPYLTRESIEPNGSRRQEAFLLATTAQSAEDVVVWNVDDADARVVLEIPITVQADAPLQREVVEATIGTDYRFVSTDDALR